MLRLKISDRVICLIVVSGLVLLTIESMWMAMSSLSGQHQTDRVVIENGRNLSGQQQRLLCFVLSSADRVASSLSVKETWGSRCDRLLFFSSTKIAQLDSIVLDDPADGYYRLWGKVRSIWKYLGQSEHLHHFDWFLKADDDTYIVVDNLRNFLLDHRRIADQEQEKAVWFGARLRHPKVYGGYHSGGAGYVLNRQALLLFDDGRNCSQINFGYEDLQMGRCLEKLGVDVVDTVDSSGLPTFLPFSPEELLFPRQSQAAGHIRTFNDPLANGENWYWKSLWSPHQLGRNCCSPHAISFHHVKPKMMYAIDFLIYSLKLDHHKKREPDHEPSI